ncbi:venom carboxylesterase-6-like [Trichogramma pretiosum]|uniref:venom carboxylesterase-6-like n=1 Tax=Trichogramma pretiosum TaxID=7493 RepID=UPI0006C9BF08|nr:venom carboxylesterase-6-like [Trichogramma pretiosum]
MIVLWFLVLLSLCTSIACEDDPCVVRTSFGRIKGSYKESYEGKKYLAFEGVPYALPPVGHRRFRPPEPVSRWEGTLTATKIANACIQLQHNDKYPDYEVVGDEDCLYLNIYVPQRDTRQQEPLAVLFGIHGGAYQFGEAFTGVQFLMDEDAIVVTVAYRLGSFGFLSTEDEHALGNMGLKDQSTALRWVSENIADFGGDPDKITLFGNSAGSASVHYHYLSPWSRGLFQNGVSFSGSSYGPGKQTEHAREKARRLADLLGCPSEELAEMVECLRYRPARSIAQATKHFMPWMYNPFTPFGPVVEYQGDRPFVNRPPVEIIADGDAFDALWIAGIVSEEGLYPVAEYVNNDAYLRELDENWETIAPHLLDFNFTIPLEQHAEVARKIRRHYFGDRPIDRRSVDRLIKLVGDRLYVVDIEKAARDQAQKNRSPVLVYYYSYRALTSQSDYYSHSMKDYGVSHGDDISMIIDRDNIYPPLNSRDRLMQKKLIRFLVSVAKKGFPDMGIDFDWQPVNPKRAELDYLHIRSPCNIKMESNDNLAEKNFWSSIRFNENILP